MSNNLIGRILSNPPVNPPLDQPYKPSFWERIQDAYDNLVGGFIRIIRANGWFNTGAVLGALLLEPISSIRAAFEYVIYGCFCDARFSNVNPVELSDEQLEFNPVLCIHGNFHAETAYTSIAAELENHPTYKPGVFTVAVNSGEVTEEDFQLIEARMDEIIDL